MPGAPAAQHEVPIAEYTQLPSNITLCFGRRANRLLWLSTTPMPAAGLPNRLNSDIVAYNAAAARVVHGLAPLVAVSGGRLVTCDMYKFVEDHCGAGYVSCDWQTASPHFRGHYDKL
eukprot:SAG11_NODE_19283_length_470_cov_0.838275_1_plen_116_part_01